MRTSVVYLLFIGLLLVVLMVMGGCAPVEDGEEAASFTSYIPLIVMLGLMVVIFYFIMIRPIRQREKKHDEMVSDLEKGDQVITAGGIYSTIEKVDENSVVLRVESGATIRVTKGGVIQKPED